MYGNNQCTTRSTDKVTVEVLSSVSFNTCTHCVHWMDKNDDEIDDQYYVNKQTNAPLCSAMWAYKEECNGKCQLMGKESVEREGWNKADKVLLSILSLFGESPQFCTISTIPSISI